MGVRVLRLVDDPGFCFCDVGEGENVPGGVEGLSADFGSGLSGGLSADFGSG